MAPFARFLLAACCGWVCLGAGPLALHATPDSLLTVLSRSGPRMLQAEWEVQRLAAADSFHGALRAYVDQDGSWNVLQKSVPNLSILPSDDGRVALLTYVVPRTEGQYDYFGVLRAKTDQGAWKTQWLTDSWSKLGTPEYARATASTWPGALVYRVVPVRQRTKTHYLLLGFRPLDGRVHQKVVDVLTLDRNGDPRFGGAFFDVKSFNGQAFRKRPYRLVLRYSASVTASVRWDAPSKRVVVEHCAPRGGEAANAGGAPDYSSFGPDLTYDVLVFKSGKWTLQENVDLRSPVRPTRSIREPQDGLRPDPNQP
jgi:hypothetical protein